MYLDQRRRALLFLFAFCLFLAARVDCQQPASEKTGAARAEVKRAMSNLRIQATFHVQGHPDWMVVTPEAVWVTSSGANRVTELRPTTNQVGMTISVAKPCSGLLFAFGSLWIPSCGDRILVRANPATGATLAKIPAGPADSEGGITSGAGSVWLVTRDGVLARIHPATSTVQAEIAIASGSSNPLFADGFVWISSHAHNSLLKVDPSSNQVVATIGVGKGPRFLAADRGSLWTLNQGDGTMTRVNTSKGTVVATIEAGIAGEGGEIAFGFNQLWATLFGFPITRVDPATSEVVAQWAGLGGDSIRTGFGSVWLTNLKTGEIWRIAPEDTK